MLISSWSIFTVSSPIKTRSQLGLTLIELLITLSILAILLLAAIPGFSYWRAKAESQMIIYTLHNQLQTARQLAIARGTTTSLCGSNAQGVCQLRNFSHLQIFVDTNRNKRRDANEELISRTTLALSGQLRLNNHTSLQFKNNGSSYTPASFIYCPATPLKQLVQRVTLSFTGRPYIAQHNAKGVIRNAGGSAITCPNWDKG